MAGNGRKGSPNSPSSCDTFVIGDGNKGLSATFGARVKRRREILGITQQGLAEASGVGSETIKKIEEGRGNPTIDTAGRLALSLGVSPNYLMGFHLQLITDELDGWICSHVETGDQRKLLTFLKEQFPDKIDLARHVFKPKPVSVEELIRQIRARTSRG